MKRLLKSQLFFVAATTALLSACDSQNWTDVEMDGYRLITQPDGATLGYSPASGVKILTVDGKVFKDMNRNGMLDPYEDWRLTFKERAADLASQMSIDEIAGLMLYSSHLRIPSADNADTLQPWLMGEQVRVMLEQDNVRHLLITTVQSPEIAARWNNEVQAFAESLPLGIPANNSSDPRHNARSDSEFNAGGGGQISMWPGSLGFGATFDPQVMERFGQIASIEYRGLGFATCLSPQVDLCTEPRWMRFSGTMTEEPRLAADLARAYCDGFQYSDPAHVLSEGWGYQSVNAMVKHWPGGGCGEGGRDAHYGWGKFAVFPSGNLELAKIPFTQGAFKLQGETRQASAVMPYYTISWGQGSADEQVGNSYSRDVITRQLREEHNYDGVICTDWGITQDEIHPGVHSGKPWGVEHLTEAERHYKALMAGVDQYGGNNAKGPVLEAFEIGVKEHGEEWMTQRMRESARRLLTNIFHTGLFENPYVDPAYASQTVGCPEYMQEGYEAQIRSVVMLKNQDNVLPLNKQSKATAAGQDGTPLALKVYIPKRHYPAWTGFWGNPIEEQDIVPVSEALGSRYFTLVDNAGEADVAIVYIDSPNSRFGYDMDDVKRGGNGYVPISLQYSNYTATTARKVSIAGGDPFEKSNNRSYRGKSIKTVNRGDMVLVQETRKAMGRKPVIVSVNVSNPPVLSEIEPYADAIFCTFDVQNQVILDLVTGRYEPSGLLPFQLPKDMLTVEANAEDKPRDLECYRDAQGHTYDFAYGMNWQGVIDDERVQKYR